MIESQALRELEHLLEDIYIECLYLNTHAVNMPARKMMALAQRGRKVLREIDKPQEV